MRSMGLEAIYPKGNPSKRNQQHRVYPYLLKDISINRPNFVWSTDITYIRINRGFVYLTAIIDWYSRYVVAWQLSNTLDGLFCLDALDLALAQGTPVLVYLLILVALIALTIRLIFLFPTLALGESLDLSSRWRETKGNAWRILAAVVLATCPPFILIMTVAMGAVLFVPEETTDAALADSEPVLELTVQESLVFAALAVATALFIKAVFAAVVSVAYARLTCFEARGLSSG